jgi:hypothetical protein
MFKQVINHPGFWKSVATLAVIFCVVYILIDIIFTYDLNFANYKASRLVDFNFIKLILGGLASGSVYGFIVSYFKFKAKLKESDSERED